MTIDIIAFKSEISALKSLESNLWDEISNFDTLLRKHTEFRAQLINLNKMALDIDEVTKHYNKEPLHRKLCALEETLMRQWKLLTQLDKEMANPEEVKKILKGDEKFKVEGSYQIIPEWLSEIQKKIRMLEQDVEKLVEISIKKRFSFECALKDIQSGTYYGARIDWDKGTFSFGSEELDNYLKKHTRIDELLKKFANLKSKDYDDFMRLYVSGGYQEELIREGFDIGYFKLGVGRPYPQALILYVSYDKKNWWENKLSE